MTYPMAIVIAAALIAGAVLLSNRTPPAEAGSDDWVPIGIMGKKAWMGSTETGQMRFCEPQRNYSGDEFWVQCSKLRD